MRSGLLWGPLGCCGDAVGPTGAAVGLLWGLAPTGAAVELLWGLPWLLWSCCGAVVGPVGAAVGPQGQFEKRYRTRPANKQARVCRIGPCTDVRPSFRNLLGIQQR